MDCSSQNVRKIEKALKASWFKLIYKSCEGWAAFPNMYGLNNAYVYGNVYLKKLHTRVGNTLWADTPLALYTVYKCAQYYGKDSTLSIPLWYNQNVMEGKISNWSNKGLKHNRRSNRRRWSNTFNRGTKNIIQENCNFSFYIREFYILHKRKIQDILKQHDFIWDKQTPQLPCILHVLDIGTQGIKNVYFSTIESVYNIIKQVLEKWAKTF